MKKRPPPGPDSAEIAELFGALMEGVTPIKPHGRIEHPRKTPRPVPRPRTHHGHAAPDDVFSDHIPDSGASEQSFVRPGLTRQAVRNLRRAGSVENELDLHGLTSEEARRLLAQFLAECKGRDLRRVRIVHGKGLRSSGGRPVLQALVRAWLRQCDDVLAFFPARPEEGGSGAVVVLLRAR